MFKKLIRTAICFTTVFSVLQPVSAMSQTATKLPSAAINPDQSYQIPAPTYKAKVKKRVKKGRHYITVSKTVKKKYRDITWQTDSTNIRLSPSGKVIPLKAGKATVYGRAGDRLYSKQITVRYYHKFDEEGLYFGKGKVTYTASSYADVVGCLIKAAQAQKEDCFIKCRFKPDAKKMETLGNGVEYQMFEGDLLDSTSLVEHHKGVYWYSFAYCFPPKIDRLLNSTAARLTKGISGNAIDKTLALNKILEPDKYDYKLQAFTSYNAIIDHIAICCGYSAGFQRLARSCGVDSCLIYTSDHVWNLVRYNGKWYGIDTTWNSPDEGCTIDTKDVTIDGRTYTVPYFFGEGYQLPEHDNPLKCIGNNMDGNNMFVLNTFAQYFDQKQKQGV